MKKKILTNFVTFVILIVAAAIPTSFLGAEIGLPIGVLVGMFGNPIVVDFLDKQKLIK